MHNHVIFALQSLVGFPKLCLIRFTINSNVHKFEVDVKCFIFFVIFRRKNYEIHYRIVLRDIFPFRKETTPAVVCRNTRSSLLTVVLRGKKEKKDHLGL